MKFLLTLLISASLVNGAIYYVDFDAGDDSANGTSTVTAWKHSPGDTNATSTADSTTLSAGDTVKFKGGAVYLGGIVLEWSGSSGSPITYDGNHAGDWGNGRAVVDREYLLNGSCFRANAARSHLVIRGFEIRNAGGWADDSQAVIDAAEGTVTNTVNTGGIGVNFWTAGNHTNIAIHNLYIHRIGGWRNTQGWTANTINGGGILVKSGHGIIITNCEMTKMKTAIGLHSSLEQSNLLVSSNNIHDYIVWGIDVTPLGNNGVIRDLAILNNAIHDYAQFNAGNWEGVGEHPHTDGIFLRTAGYTNSIWSNVVVNANDFYCDNPENSLGGTASIYVSEGPSADIFNNVFNQDSHTRVIGVEYANAGGGTNVVRIYNNTLVTQSIMVIMDGETDPNKRQVYIQNNVFLKPAGTAANSVFITQIDGVPPAVLDNNLYYDPDWTVSQKYVALLEATGYSIFATVQGEGYEADGLYDDPDFVSFGATPSGRDLRLQSTSPAIGAGTNLSAYFTTDKNGVARGSTWDIGAYEFAATSTWTIGTLNAVETRSGSVSLP